MRDQTEENDEKLGAMELLLVAPLAVAISLVIGFVFAVSWTVEKCLGRTLPQKDE